MSEPDPTERINSLRPGGRLVRRRKKKKEPVQKGPNFMVPGVIRMGLSPYTQMQMKLVIGDDVTAEKPWKWIKKAAILENIEVFLNNSDFKHIKIEMREVKGESVLIGYCPDDTKDYDDFYVCLTDDATEAIKVILDKQAEEKEQWLANSVHKTVYDWTSLGSELEIDASIAKNTRPLLEVEIESIFPTESQALHFYERHVNDVRDGYAELRATRQGFSNIQRKRLETGTQNAPSLVNNVSQTDPPYPKNISTQYAYDCSEAMEKSKTEKALRRVKVFVSKCQDEMVDQIRFNGVIDMYVNDYPLLLEKGRGEVDLVTGDSMIFRDFMCFTDIRICKDKSISCSDWHPMWSGVAAVAYVNNAACSLFKFRNEEDVVNKAVHELNPVLIWSFNESLRPKLSLENYREVTALSFCPYDENIIIGGCSSGQILIWDLTKRLQKVEEEEVLTVAQAKYRALMFSHMEWMKNIKNDASVRPAAGSNLQFSHLARVTKIHWISPYHTLTRNGMIRAIPPGSPTSRQFITASEDGTLLAWDLNMKIQAKPQGSTKGGRLAKRPAGLTTDVSPYKKLDRIFAPHYRICAVKPNQDKIKSAMSSFSMKSTKMRYEQSSATPPIYNVTNRIIYRPVFDYPSNLIIKPEFIGGASEGDFFIHYWEGYDFNQGSAINTENSKLTSRGIIHDGPILAMDRHPFIPHMLLTVGGKIFAMWHEKFLNRPLFWKKSKVKLTSGMWSRYKSNIFFLTRMEGSIEVWDLLYRSQSAAVTQSISGKILTTISVHRLPLRKNVIAIGDYNGSFRCFYVPPAYQKTDKQDLPKMDEFFEKERIRMSSLEDWQKEWIKGNMEILKRKKLQEEYEKYLRDLEAKAEAARREAKLRAEEEERRRLKALESDKGSTFAERAEKAWKNNLQTHMQTVLLSKKRLKREDLEIQQRPLKIQAAQQHKKMQRLKARYAEADKIYEDQIAILFPDTVKPKPMPPMVKKEEDEDEEEEETIFVPPNYLADYQQIEEEAVDYIDRNPYIYNFDWKNVLHDGKDRRLLIDTNLAKMIAHRQRQEDRRRSRVVGDVPPSEISLEFEINRLAKLGIFLPKISETDMEENDETEDVDL